MVYFGYILHAISGYWRYYLNLLLGFQCVWRFVNECMRCFCWLGVVVLSDTIVYNVRTTYSCECINRENTICCDTSLGSTPAQRWSTTNEHTVNKTEEIEYSLLITTWIIRIELLMFTQNDIIPAIALFILCYFITAARIYCFQSTLLGRRVPLLSHFSYGSYTPILHIHNEFREKFCDNQWSILLKFSVNYLPYF